MFCSFERYVVCFVSLLSSCSFGFVSVLYLSWFSVLFMFCVLFCWRMGGFCFVLFYVFFNCLFVCLFFLCLPFSCLSFSCLSFSCLLFSCLSFSCFLFYCVIDSCFLFMFCLFVCV